VVCGNEIAAPTPKCPYCDSARDAGHAVGNARQEVMDVIIKAGMPSVESALARLDQELWRAGQDRVRVVRVIHGWGSSGVGGKLRPACRTYLKQLLAARRVTDVVAGEDYSAQTGPGRNLLRRCPSLRASLNADSGNQGLTLVGL
jgi:hypothetical protein